MEHMNERGRWLCDGSYDLEIMDVIGVHLFPYDSLEEIRRQYDILREKYVPFLSKNLADQVLSRANQKTEDTEHLLAAVEWHLTDKRGAIPDEQEVTAIFRRCMEKCGGRVDLRKIERLLKEESEQRAK